MQRCEFSNQSDGRIEGMILIDQKQMRVALAKAFEAAIFVFDVRRQRVIARIRLQQRAQFANGRFPVFHQNLGQNGGEFRLADIGNFDRMQANRTSAMRVHLREYRRQLCHARARQTEMMLTGVQ